LNVKSFQFAGGLNNAIILELPGKLRKNLNKNCKALSNAKTNKIVKIILMMLPILAIVGVGVYFLINMTMDNVAKENEAKELLNKYTYVADSSLNKFYDMDLELISIEDKVSEGLFEDEFLSFRNPYDNSLYSAHFDVAFKMNRYSGQTDLDIIYLLENNFDDYNFESLNAKYTISINNVLNKNNIKTRVDLVHAIYNNDSKDITTKSTEAEMIEHYVFDILKPVVIPYDFESSKNELLILKGSKTGYVHITDKKVTIVLENNEQEYEIVYKYTNEEITKLTKDEIIDVVSTIKFN